MDGGEKVCRWAILIQYLAGDREKCRFDSDRHKQTRWISPIFFVSKPYHPTELLFIDKTLHSNAFFTTPDRPIWLDSVQKTGHNRIRQLNTNILFLRSSFSAKIAFNVCHRLYCFICNFRRFRAGRKATASGSVAHTTGDGCHSDTRTDPRCDSGR